MTYVADLEIRKYALKADLAADKTISDKVSQVQHEINGINCKDIIRQCKSRRDLAKKYKKKYTERKRKTNALIKSIDASIKKKTKRKRCPKGHFRNKSTGSCDKK